MEQSKIQYLFLSLRPAHWTKNLLVFLPLIFAQKFSEQIIWLQSLASFLIFSLAASAVYCFNDYFDCKDDRQHPSKCLRPFARGNVASSQILAVASILAIVSLLLSFILNSSSFTILLVYFILNFLYFRYFKKLIFIDIMVLSVFYLLRVYFAGSVTHVGISPWLVGFAILVFLQLGLLKRWLELKIYQISYGRTYHIRHLPIIQGLALASYLLLIALLVSFIHFGPKRELYAHPAYLWGSIAIVALWFPALWLTCQNCERNKICDDPVLVAISRPSFWFLGLSAAFFWWRAW